MALTEHPLYRIVAQYSRALGAHVGHQIAHDLKNMRQPLLSGDDSGLSSVWMEICAQVQGEESFFWDAYMQVMRDFALSRLQSVSQPELEMLWMQTDSGWDWVWDVLNADDSAPAPPLPGVDEEAVARWLISEFVIPLAEEDEDPSVAQFLENC